MNRILKTGLIACAAASFIVPVARAAETADLDAADTQASGYSPIGAIGLATPVQLPWGFDWDMFGIDLNLFYADCMKMYGWELSAGANTARREFIGLQTATVFNMANRKGIGAQLSLFNMANREFTGLSIDAVGLCRDFYGFRADLLGSGCSANLYGFQAAIVGNAVKEDMYGLQAAPGANFARRVHGCQIAMAYNQTSELRGCQIGLVNYTTYCPVGFQIGLVNIIMENVCPFLPFVNASF